MREIDSCHAARHDNIGKEQVDPFFAVEHKQCGGAAIRLDDRVAKLSQSAH
jgi:hypothetical protein